MLNKSPEDQIFVPLIVLLSMLAIYVAVMVRMG